MAQTNGLQRLKIKQSEVDPNQPFSHNAEKTQAKILFKRNLENLHNLLLTLKVSAKKFVTLIYKDNPNAKVTMRSLGLSLKCLGLTPRSLGISSRTREDRKPKYASFI